MEYKRAYHLLQMDRARKKAGGGRKARILSKSCCGSRLHIRLSNHEEEVVMIVGGVGGKIVVVIVV